MSEKKEHKHQHKQHKEKQKEEVKESKHHHKHHKEEKEPEPRPLPAAAMMSPASPIDPSEDYDANRAAIEALCKISPNNVCADCNSAGTRWASVNHGVFVCIRCSGFHRAMGTHISKVKSTNMDKWSAVEIDLMESIGNRKGKEMYEARLRRKIDSSITDAELKAFIEQKYENYDFSQEDVEETLRRLQKHAGYKGGKKKAELAAKALASEKKKSKTVEGAFGTVNVPLEEHDKRRAKLLSYFGVS